MKQSLTAIKMLALMTVITGALYPLVMTGAAYILFPKQAGGSLVIKEGKTVGSAMIAQGFTSDKYFWPRPSASGYDPLHSGGTQWGPTSRKLQEAVSERKKKLGENAPAEMLFSSGSGLDPHLSMDSVLFQLERVAKARGIDPLALRTFVIEHTEGRELGLFGTTRVNVLKLNIAMDEAYGGR